MRLGWLTFGSRQLYFLGITTYKNTAPVYLLQVFSRPVPSQRPCRQMTPSIFIIPNFRTLTYRNSFFISAIDFWHFLALSVVSFESLSILKLHLFELLFAREAESPQYLIFIYPIFFVYFVYCCIIVYLIFLYFISWTSLVLITVRLLYFYYIFHYFSDFYVLDIECVIVWSQGTTRPNKTNQSSTFLGWPGRFSSTKSKFPSRNLWNHLLKVL